MRDKTIKYTVGFILGIIVLLAIIAGNYPGFLPLSIAGTSTLSISQAQLQSTNPYLNGQAWLLTFSAGGLGQSYYGTISPSQVDALTPDQTTTTKTLSIKVDYADQVCNYPIQNTGSFTPIYDMVYKKYACFLNPSIQDIKTNTGIQNILYYGRLGITEGFACFGVGYNTVSPVGTFNNPSVSQPYTITLNVDGKIATRTIDPSAGSAQGAVGDYAYAIWNGNLVSGSSCSSSTEYRTIYLNGNWITVKRQNYDAYASFEANNKLNGYNGCSAYSENCILNWLNQFNNAANLAKTQTSFGTVFDSSSQTNAVVKVVQGTPLQFPVTTLYVKASTLGVFTPVPNIVLSSTNSECFKAGNTGVISATIKNTGASGGTYNVYATCPSPFSSLGTSKGSLNPGEERVVNLPLSGSVTQKTTSSCTVSVESTAGTKTATVNACVDPQITCTVPYPQTFCGISGGQDIVQQCSQSGATATILQTCSATQYCDSGACVNKQTSGSSSSGVGFFDSISNFFKTLGSLLTIVKIIVLIIISLLAVFVAKTKATTILGNPRKNKVIIWILASLVGVGVAVSLYAILLTSLFWIILGIYLVVSIFLHFIPLGKYLL